MPARAQSTLLHMGSVTVPDIWFQALIDAGPGTEADRAEALRSVATEGPHVPLRGIDERLRKWRFDMRRLRALGVTAPDPAVQRNAITHFVAELCEADREFEYRLKRLHYDEEYPRRGGASPGR